MLDLVVDYNFSPGEVSVNHSFICRSSLTTNNVTATLGKDPYLLPVTSTLKNIQMQAFNKIQNQPNFAECEYSEPSIWCQTPSNIVVVWGTTNRFELPESTLNWKGNCSSTMSHTADYITFALEPEFVSFLIMYFLIYSGRDHKKWLS